MKKTLLITYFFPPLIGGMENYFFNLCGGLPADRLVVLAQNYPEARAFDQKQKYPIYRAEFFSGRFRPRWRNLKNDIQAIISHEKIEQLAFGHFHPFNIIGVELPLPLVIFGHGTDITQIKKSWWQKFTFKKVYRRANRFIVNSNFLAQEIKSLVGNNSKVSVVYPGVDFTGLNEPISDLSQEKNKLGLQDSDLILLSLCRLEPEKNLGAVIRSLPMLLDKVSNLKYLIVGAGSQRAALEEMVVQLDIKNQVRFIGAIENISSAKRLYYQLAHLFIVPSLKPEGFGISYLEAQACRTPVIASRFGGSAEAVLDGHTGILVDPASQTEMTAAIYKLISDKVLWEQMAAASQARIKQEFNWLDKIEEVKKLLE